jgi:hypothetical protein
VAAAITGNTTGVVGESKSTSSTGVVGIDADTADDTPGVFSETTTSGCAPGTATWRWTCARLMPGRSPP